MYSYVHYITAWGCCLLLGLGCRPSGSGSPSLKPTNNSPPKPRIVREIPWGRNGVWLKADTHIHSTFSDGGFPIGVLAERAREFGCQVIALTDHADQDLTAASPEYFAQINDVRQRFPQLTILSGLEWNVPLYGGDEHATMLVSPLYERAILSEFKARFDDYVRTDRPQDLAEQAMKWLIETEEATRASNSSLSGSASPPDPGLLLVLNHPSRKRTATSSVSQDLLKWRALHPGWIGLEGGPGHQQRTDPVAAYDQQLKTVHRWDPVVEPGDTWDQLLQQRVDVWGAISTSDFHEEGGDYWPGQFSETYLWAPDSTAAGAMRALQSGSFFGVHGWIARQVTLKVTAPQLERPAMAGEVLEVPANTSVSVALELEVPEMDWQGAPNHLDVVELIAIDQTGVRIVASQSPMSTAEKQDLILVEAYSIPAQGIVFRARGRRRQSTPSDLMFYTNPIRIVLK